MSTVAELQRRIQLMESRPSVGKTIPTRPDLARLISPGLREGAVYRVHESTSLALIATTEASQEGRWTAWVGWPHLGAEAMHRAGLVLERTALVPCPGERWLPVVSALADAMSIVVVRVPRNARVSESEAAKLTARLRERGTSMLIDGIWPHVDAEMRVEHTAWSGIGAGRGAIEHKDVFVSVRDRAGRVTRGVLSAQIDSSQGEIASHGTVMSTARELSWAVGA